MGATCFLYSNADTYPKKMMLIKTTNITTEKK